MLSITNLTPRSQDFISSVKSSTSMETSIAIARAISMRLSMPGSEIDDKDFYFIENLSTYTREVVGKLNELIIVDVSKVLEYTKMFWNIRYTACHVKAKMFPVPGCTSPNDVYGFGTVVIKEVAQAIEKDHFNICVMVNGFHDVLLDLLVVEVE